MKKGKLLLTISLTMLVLIVSICVHVTNISAQETSSSLFVNSKNITITENQSVPAILKDKDGNDVSTIFDSGKNGVLLTSNNQGSSVDFARAINGSFEVDFRVYSDVHFYDSTGSDYNSPTIAINPYCDLQELSIRFTAENGQSFDVIVTGGEKSNTITAAARVKIGDAEFGYHYLNDATTPNDTSLKNSGGYFTRIGGTTFSNVTKRGGILTDESAPITIGFDYETMEIYCYHYGTNAHYTKGERRVIADLNSEDIGLNKFIDFNNYKVTFGFNSIAEGKTAKMLIYSINGQKLSGTKLTDNVGPDTIAYFKTNSVSGVKYFLPDISRFDVLDDDSKCRTVVSVKASNGSPLNLYKSNGKIILNNEYEKGCYFTPTIEGEITISYTSYDSKNKAGKTQEYSIYNFANVPDSSFDYEGLENNYDLATKGEGDTLKIYPCKVNSPLLLGVEAECANVSIYKDGNILENYNGKVVEHTESIKLEAGTYKLVYYIDGFYNENYSYEFTVSNTTPVVEFSSELSEKYIYGNSIEIPAAKYTLNGVTKRATAVLYDPDGQYVDTSSEPVLDKIGTYKLIYMVNFDKTYTFDYYFTSVHSSHGLFIEQKGVTVEYGSTGNLYKNEVNGLVLTYTKGDTEVKFGKVLDLSKNTKFDSLIELITLPSERGVADALQYTIKLTDVYNENNYVTITVYKGSSGNQWSYVKAGATGQVLSGLENEKVLTSYEYGAPIHYSMTGESIVDNEIFQIFYDYSEKALYADNVKRGQYSYGNQVIDMDNKEHFSEKTLWDGFTTGEVYLTISVQSLQSEKAQILVKSINGVSFENEWIQDEEVPIITIDTFGYNLNNLPVGVVNRSYNLFPARAYDSVDGLIDYELFIYKDYQTMAQKLVSTNKNSFIPTEAGNYTLVYKVTDSSMNFVIESVKIKIASSLEELSYRFDYDLEDSIYVGEYLNIPDGLATGGSGNIDISISVIGPDGEKIETYKNEAFISKEGMYKVSVSLSDYIGNEKTVVYEVVASINGNPIVEDLHYNQTMIEGYEYDLSQFIALDYFSNNGIAASAIKSVEIIQNGKTTQLGSSMIYTPFANENGEEITIRFIAKNNFGNGTTVLERKAYLLKVLDETGKNFNFANLFYQHDIKSVNPHSDYVEYVTNVDGAFLEYANYLVADAFSMKLTVNKDMNNFSAIQITLVDSENSYQKIVFTINKSGKSISTASLNNVKNLSITSDFYQTTSQNFWFYFNAKANSLVDGNTNKVISLVKNNYDGSTFEGFTSGKVKASIKYLGVEGDSAIRVSSISNQVISNYSKDRIAPAIQVMGDLKKISEINEIYTVYKAVATDGVDPTVKAYVEIMKDGKNIYSAEISEDYNFVPTEYGKYTITYSAVDRNKRDISISYVITIKDRIKPQLTINGEVMSTAKVGKSYTLPTATVTDNNDSSLPVYVFIMAPDGEQRANAANDYSFNPTLRGEYKITYYTYDSYNCYTYVEYIIKVE